jgi:hypothetical protein
MKESGDKPQDIRGGVNKGDITTSEKFLLEFLVNSLGTYQRAMQLGMDDLEAGSITKEKLLEEIKVDMKLLLSGTFRDVPEGSPNKKDIEETAKMLGDDKVLDEYIKVMDNSITNERDRLLEDKGFIRKAEKEIKDGGNEVDESYIKTIALREASANSSISKDIKEIVNGAKNTTKKDGSKFWEKAAKFFKTIGCNLLAEKCTKRQEEVQISEAARSIKNALIKGSKLMSNVGNKVGPEVKSPLHNNKGGRGF